MDAAALQVFAPPILAFRDNRGIERASWGNAREDVRMHDRVRFAVALTLAAAWALPARADWTSFRGREASGVSEGQNLPASWDVKTGANVRWKTEIPGLGHSSPIVSRDRVFVTTAVTPEMPSIVLGDEGGIRLADERTPHSWRLYCLDATSGRILWHVEAHSDRPPAKRHVKASHANATPATDGRTVVAIFPAGLFAFDFEGRAKWRADLGLLNPGLFGDIKSEWGHASSPVIYENLAIVQVDRHQESYLAAFDLETGRRVWSVKRDERPVWSTPLLHHVNGRAALAVAGGYYNRGYDPRTGAELWRFKDEAEVKTPTPFAAEGLIVFSGGYRGRPIFALKAGGSGDLSVPADARSGAFLAWRTEPGGPYTSTPVAYRGILYGVRDEGIAFAYDLATGERVFRERTGTTHSASPVASDGKIYVAAEAGEVLVLKAGRSFEVLARNDMGESCMATPAISNGSLFVRTRGHVYAIGATRERVGTADETATRNRSHAR
jgi:outer membrane protein assembly factor BamB